MTSESPPELINLTYVLYDFENLNNLSNIYQLCFGHRPNQSYFKWKYLNNPAGKAIAFLALDGGIVAGFYCVIPEFYIINGKKEIIYQSVDTMTHPGYRRLGIFTTLAHMTYDYVRQKEGRLHLIGFPGKMSYSGFVDTLKWDPVIHLDYVFTYKFLFRLFSFVRNPGMDVEEIETFGEEFDEYFAKREKSIKPISRYIDRSIANWRIIEHPDNKYRLAKVMKNEELIGYFVYRLDKKQRAFVINIDVVKPEYVLIGLRGVCRYLFLKEDIKSIYTFQSGSRFEEAYRKSGFLVNPTSRGPFSYKTPFIVYGDKEIEGINWFNRGNFDIQPIVRDY